MTRFKGLIAALAVAASTAVIPAANAQTVHYVGVGSSAQWQEAALGTYKKAQGLVGGGQCSYHFTAKGNNSDLDAAAVMVDSARNSNIPNEPGNVWLVWIAACGSPNTNVTDVWLDITVDSTVGVRGFFSATKVGLNSVQGATVSLDSSNRTSSDAIKAALWSDGSADTGTAVESSILSVVNGAHVNVGLTDIRPEDALFATTRTLAAYSATGSGLGYNHGPVTGVGNSIISDITATAIATPVKFALSGTDPFSHAKIASFATVPVGAAPIVYIMNNGGTSPIALDVEDGWDVTTQTQAGADLLGALLDGTTTCDPSNPAFNGTGVGASPLTVFLREPLSGTMNTNEFSVIRTSYNATDTQEKGITTTTTTPFNPLNLQCGASHTLNGFRRRGVGTGDIVTGVTGTSNSLGYIFFSFGNVSGIAANTKYNYLTLDGVDPLAIPGTLHQELPTCSVPNCTQSAVWGTGNLSYPHLRDGSYRDWSLYRWVGQPGSPHFCSDNNTTNAVATCQPQATLPKTTYSKTTGKLVVFFPTANAFPFFVGQVVTLNGYTGNDAPLNGTHQTITAATDSGTTHSITMLVGTGKTYETSDLTDPATVSVPADPYGIQAVAQAAQDEVDTDVDDFVPFNPTTGTDGLNVYRSHTTYLTFTANNGPQVISGTNLTRGGGVELGRDEGGCIELHDVDVITGATNDTGCSQ